jgi:hypothetical protein
MAHTPALVTLNDPISPASEAYRTLRMNLQFAALAGKAAVEQRGFPIRHVCQFERGRRIWVGGAKIFPARHQCGNSQKSFLDFKGEGIGAPDLIMICIGNSNLCCIDACVPGLGTCPRVGGSGARATGRSLARNAVINPLHAPVVNVSRI